MGTGGSTRGSTRGSRGPKNETSQTIGDTVDAGGAPKRLNNGKKNKKNLVCEICELHLMKIHTKKVGDTVEAGGAAKWFGQCERTPAHIINNLSTGLLLNTRCTLYIDHILIG